MLLLSDRGVDMAMIEGTSSENFMKTVKEPGLKGALSLLFILKADLGSGQGFDL